MRSRFAVLSALTLLAAVPASAQFGDEAAIRALVQAQETTFNTHDAAAFGQYFEADADFVTTRGALLEGRDAYVQRLSGAFAGPIASAHVHADDIKVRLLGPGVAVAIIRWSDSAVRTDNQAIETQTLRRQADGRWLIAASQETDVVSETAARTKPEKAAKEAPAAPAGPPRKCLLGRPNGDCLLYK